MVTIDRMLLGCNLTVLREAAGLTQYRVGEALGCGGTPVCRWERGDFVPNARYLVALARLYGVTMDDLFTGCTVDAEQPAQAETGGAA